MTHNPDRSPAERLNHEPWSLDFFQAVRLIESVTAGRKPIGADGPPSAEFVHFQAALSLAFPASAITDYRPATEDQTAQLAVSFFGMTGPSGVLPQSYTQVLMRQSRSQEGQAAAAWLNLFTHRFLSHFYRAWAKYRLPVQYETARKESRTDPITTGMLALIGLGTPGMSGRLHGVPDESLLPYAPLFQENARPTIGLERLLSSYFRISVSVQSFVGRWVRLATDDQTRLGRFGQHHQLGNGAITGQRIWDVSNSLQIQIGPLEYADFQTWLPDQKQMLRLMELMRLYLRDSLDFEVQLLLNPRQAPPLQLTRKRSPRLGWNCWLGTNRQQSGDCRFSSSRFPSSLGG